MASPAAAEPLKFYNGRLFISATVNGVRTEALLDSAAEATLVDPSLASRAQLAAGKTQAIRGSGGTAQARLVEGVRISAVGQELDPEAVVVTDLGELSRRLIKRPTAAVIGRELFDAARLRIDIDHGSIIAVARNRKPAGARLQLMAEHGVEAIPARVSAFPVRAEFDLGNGSEVMISRAVATKLGLKIKGRSTGGGIGGAVQRDLVILPRLTVGGVRFKSVTAAIDDQSNAGELNIGTAILKHFTITTDFARRSVWLASNGN